jgi:hypothetical protein
MDWLAERLEMSKTDVVELAIRKLAESEAQAELSLPGLARAISELREEVGELRKRLPPAEE